MNRLQGKVAVVTGASKGIGAAIAKALASDGASVVVNYASSREGADRVVAEIVAADGRAVAVQADVSKAADVKRLLAETLKAFGAPSILVNNAAVYGFQPLAEITEAEFHRQFNLNVLGVLLTTQEAVKHFGAEGGSVINVSSGAATSPMPGSAVYSASKAALDTITVTLSKELGPRKIRVNTVSPGPVDTEGARTLNLPEEIKRMMVSMTPLGRIGEASDIGPVAAFLASDDARWITGEVIRTAGGLR